MCEATARECAAVDRVTARLAPDDDRDGARAVGSPLKPGVIRRFVVFILNGPTTVCDRRGSGGAGDDREQQRGEEGQPADDEEEDPDDR